MLTLLTTIAAICLITFVAVRAQTSTRTYTEIDRLREREAMRRARRD